MDSAVTAQSRPTPICVSTMPMRVARGIGNARDLERRVVEKLAAADQAKPPDAGEEHQTYPVQVQDVLHRPAFGAIDAEDEDGQHEGGSKDHAGGESTAGRVLAEEHDIDRIQLRSAESAAGMTVCTMTLS